MVTSRAAVWTALRRLRGHGGGGTHGADGDDGAVLLDGGLEAVGVFFHGVGAVGDDDAGGVGFGFKEVIDALREGEPEGNVGAADVRDLFDFDVGDEGDLGDGRDGVVAAEESALAGDGAAGGEDPDDGFLGGGLGECGSEEEEREGGGDADT